MNKKTFLVIVIILILCIVGVGIYLIVKNNPEAQPKTDEIEPVEEISEEQMRTTLVTLYYQNSETKQLTPEGRMVDVKNLLTDPYTELINLLIEVPKNEKLQTVIPTGTKVLKTELKEDIVYVDFSKEFIENHQGGENEQLLTINSIVNTLTELNEVNGVKILINGQENKSFKDEKIGFKNIFTRNSTKDENEIKNNNIVINAEKKS